MTMSINGTFFLRPRMVATGLAAVGILALTGAFAFAQGPMAKSDPNVSSDPDKGKPYDKHDFNGLWSRSPQTYKQPPCQECRDQNLAPGYGFFGDVPSRTAEGQKKMDLNHPSRGYELNSADAKAHPEVDSGYRRAIIPAKGNDPEGRCEPLGAMRLVTFSGGGATMQMVQQKDLVIQRFEWTWDNREIWTDGRALPKVDDYLPRYNGYSVGKWEGDTLVVTTVGLDDRQWVDQFGFPISDKAVLEERYTRPSPNRLRVDMTLTDPVIYTKPWHASPKIWALVPKEAMSIGGWSGILEDRCIPSDEALFNTFRNHAAGIK
jgi:hypothetical protein